MCVICKLKSTHTCVLWDLKQLYIKKKCKKKNNNKKINQKGPIGRQVSASAGAGDKGMSAFFSYSHSQGLFGGLGLDGQVITVRPDCNAKFYGNKVNAKDILSGDYPNYLFFFCVSFGFFGVFFFVCFYTVCTLIAKFFVSGLSMAGSLQTKF